MTAITNNALIAPGLQLIDANSNTYTVVAAVNTSGAFNYLFVNSSNYIAFTDVARSMIDLNQVMKICQVSNLTNGSPAFYFPVVPTTVYSTRQVVSAYSGNSVNLRRTSDNTTKDIGFVAGGFDYNSALTFANGSQLYVTKWYDQSGNQNDASQANTAEQPLLMIINNKAWLSFVADVLVSNATINLTGDQTIGCSFWQGDLNAPLYLMSDFNGSAGWLFGLNDVQGFGTYYSSGTGSFINSNTNILKTSPANMIVTRSSGNATFYVDGTISGSGTEANNISTGANLNIGGYNGGAVSQMLMNECFIYNTAINSTSISSISNNQISYWGDLGFETPYAGNAWVQFSTTDVINVGNAALRYEYTQPWTAFCALQLFGHTASFGQVIFSNVPATGTIAGYEMWLDQNADGLLRIRIIADFGGNIFLDVKGSTNLVDGKKHFVAGSYDGSGLANGVNLYVDGIPESLTVLSNDLAGNTIILGVNTQNFCVGSQQGSLAPVGPFGHFQLDNTVRSPSYIAQYSTSANLPPIDGNTVLSYALTEGTGTIAHDGSASALNGTISSANVWLPTKFA